MRIGDIGCAGSRQEQPNCCRAWSVHVHQVGIHLANQLRQQRLLCRTADSLSKSASGSRDTFPMLSARVIKLTFCRTRLVPLEPSLLPDYLHQHSLAPPAVELAVEDLLPRPEIEMSFRDRHHYLPAHDLPFHVSVCVVFAG